MKEMNHRFCIAPMMQCTDIHDRYLFRLITKQSILYTEMVTTGAIIHGECLEQLRFNESIEHPIAVQLGGSDIDDLIECSKKSEQYGYDEINLNVGCPSKAVQKGSFGACLMRDKILVRHCLEALQNEREISFVIGGADGLDKEFKKSCGRLISFGPMVWPHMLARVMLSEQLYRASTIMLNSPYHRL